MDSMLIFFAIFNILVWFHWAYGVSGELCEILDIYRFTVKKGVRTAQIK